MEQLLKYMKESIKDVFVLFLMNNTSFSPLPRINFMIHKSYIQIFNLSDIISDWYSTW